MTKEKLLQKLQGIDVESFYKKSLALESTLTPNSSYFMKVTDNDFFKTAVKVGKNSVPFMKECFFYMLQEYVKADGHLFWLYLLKLVYGFEGNYPIKPNNAGIVRGMYKDWLEWADRNLFDNEMRFYKNEMDV